MPSRLSWCAALLLVLVTRASPGADPPDWRPIAEPDAQLMFDHGRLGLRVEGRSRWTIDFDHSVELAKFSGVGRNVTLVADLLHPGANLFWVENQVHPLANRVKLFEASARDIGPERRSRNHINSALLIDFAVPSGRRCVMFRQYSGEEDDVGANDPLGYTRLEGVFCAIVDGATLPADLIDSFLHAVGLRYMGKPPAR